MINLKGGLCKYPLFENLKRKGVARLQGYKCQFGQITKCSVVVSCVCARVWKEPCASVCVREKKV